MSRRGLLTVVAGALAVLAVAGVLALQRGWVKVKGPRLPAAGPAVRALFGPLADGGALQPGRVVRVYDVRYGGIPVVIESAGGQRIGVTVLKRDPRGTQGAANTLTLSLFLSNGGGKTPEELAQTARALASALAAHEDQAPPSLITLEERQRLPGAQRLGAPLD